MTEFKVSRYVISIPLKNNRILGFSAFTGALALWEPNEREAFEAIKNKREIPKDETAVQQLAYGGFIVDKDFDEKEELKKDYKQHRFNHNIMTLTIAPTMACNFGCDYCYQGQKRAGVMSREVQDAIINVAGRAVSKIKHLHVAWYGGEPLLKKDIIMDLSNRLIEICDQNGVKYDAMMVTNGYLLDPETAEDLYKKRVKTIQVTFDGPPESHDSRRVLKGGGPTFQRIVDNISQIVDKTQIVFSTRVNIDSRNIEKIPELFELLSDKGLAYKKNFGLYLSPVEAMTRGCHDIAGVCLGKLGYGRQEAELYRLCLDRGLTGQPYPPRFHGACAAVKPKGFVIIPNGDLHKCWHTVSVADRRIGTVFDPDILQEDKNYLSWLEWNPFEVETCSKCNLLPVCTGACGYKFLYGEDTKGEAATLPCISWKYNINERLIMKAEKSGVIFPDDYDADAIMTDPGII